MALTKLPKSGIADGAIDASKIEDGTIQNQEISGTIPVDKLNSTQDLSSKTVTLQNTSVTNDMLSGSIANAKLSNSTITINGNSVSLGGSATVGVEVNWQSVITGAGSSSTAVAGNGYFIDTTSDTHTLNLPASATLGDQIAIKDYAGTFASNNLIIGRNGHNIQGAANDSLISTNRASLLLVYVDSTKGWIYAEESNVGDLGQSLFTIATGGTVTTSGDYKIHTFTGDGCFVVSQVGNSPSSPLGGPNNVDYMVVAGGGGSDSCTDGNSSGAAGGGGAGGFRESCGGAGGCYSTSPLAAPCGALTITATTYPITVGAGGAAPGTSGSPGSNSIFSTITSTGGGKGCGHSISGGLACKAGGSGGGGTGYGAYPGGSGNTPPTSPPQGNNGGRGGGYSYWGGGGGGGATAVGQTMPTSPSQPGGNGGAGATTSISTSPVTYSAGGHGAPGGPGSNGTANTGNGANATSSARAGGSGIVIIRYKFQN